MDEENQNGIIADDEFFVAISHEIRRIIIKMIGDNGFAGFSQFKKEAKAGTGTIYHHIDVLKNFIYQDKRKKYHLTDAGNRAYNLLVSQDQQDQNGSQLQTFNVDEQSENKPSVPTVEKPRLSIMDSTAKYSFRKFITFHWLYRFAIHNKPYSYLISGGIIFLCALLSMIFNVRSYLFFFFPNVAEEGGDFLNNTAVIFFGVIFGAGLVLGLSEGLTRLLFNTSLDFGKLSQYVGLPYIPILFYLVIIGFTRLFPVEDFSKFSSFTSIIMLVFQIWSMILLAFSISHVKSLQFERGLMVAILIDYGTFMVLLLIVSPIF